MAAPQDSTPGAGSRSPIFAGALAAAMILGLVLLLVLPEHHQAGAQEILDQPHTASDYLHVHDMGHSGQLIIQSRKGADRTIIRHTPESRKQVASYLDWVLGGYVADSEILNESPLVVRLRVASHDGGFEPLALTITTALPLRERNTAVSWDGTPPPGAAITVSECGGCARRWDSDYLKAAQTVGAELIQGLTRRHTDGVEVTKVVEQVIFDVDPPTDDGGLQYGTVKHELTLSITSKGGQDAACYVELGQHQSKALDLKAALKTPNGREQEMDAKVTPEPALLDDAPRTAGIPVMWVHQVECPLPSEAGRYEVVLTHQDRIAIRGRVASWYFAAHDFGQQDSLRDGYEATVEWNRPLRLDPEALRPSRPFDDDFVLTRLQGGRDDNQIRWGFKVSASKNVNSAAVYYRIPQ